MPSTPPTTYANTATLSFVKNGTNLSFTTNTVTAIDGSTLMVGVKTQSVTVITSATGVDYTFHLTSNSPDIETNVLFTDPLPAGLNIVPSSFKVNGLATTPSGTAQNVMYTFPTWAAGASHTITFHCNKV